MTRNTETDATAKAAEADIDPFADPGAGKSVAAKAFEAGAGTKDAHYKGLVESLNKRVETLEAKLARVDDKLDSASVEKYDSVKKRASGVKLHPADASGVPVVIAEDESDPEAGFVNDVAVSSYRKAMVNFRSGRYSESILGFSSFLERFADHPLAGSAQYHVGESYFRQKEYGLALQEFQRVVTSYDRSAQVSDSLRQMAHSADHLQRPEEAAGYRQQLMSMFPLSPAAAGSSSPLKTAPAHPEAIGSEGESEEQMPEVEPIQTSQQGYGSEVGQGAASNYLDTPPPSIEAMAPPPAVLTARGSSLDQPPPTAPMEERLPARQDSE